MLFSLPLIIALLSPDLWDGMSALKAMGYTLLRLYSVREKPEVLSYEIVI